MLMAGDNSRPARACMKPDVSQAVAATRLLRKSDRLGFLWVPLPQRAVQLSADHEQRGTGSPVGSKGLFGECK